MGSAPMRKASDERPLVPTTLDAGSTGGGTVMSGMRAFRSVGPMGRTSRFGGGHPLPVLHSPLSGAAFQVGVFTRPRSDRPQVPIRLNMKYVGSILALAVSVLVSVASPARGQSWVATGSMSVERVGHTATLLTDGRVLVTGGLTPAGTVTPTAELYDPAATNWTVTGSMNDGRAGHTATLLTEGVGLLAGCPTTARTGALDELLH